MWLLNTSTYRLEEFHGDDKPEYVILSHTWEEEEVSFLDVRDGNQTAFKGWRKIHFCCEQALVDEYAYIWADTCCIDKRNIVDLSEALNSMFRWYKEAAVCYTYLADVNAAEQSHDQLEWTYPETPRTLSHQPHATGQHLDLLPSFEYTDSTVDTIGRQITTSRWFTRGWTLQELLAPKVLVFYDASWVRLGTRVDHISHIETRTAIPYHALEEFVPEEYCAAQKIAWAAGRRTTRPEDRAYSLLGLLGVSLNLVYGEGSEEAFFRLQKKVIKRLDDTSIFAWDRRLRTPYPHWLLAPSPDAFEGCHIYHNYQSRAFGVDLSKTALIGTFDAHAACFEIVCASLGSFRACLAESLPQNFRDKNMLTQVNTVGILLTKVMENYQLVMLDGKQRLLFDYSGHPDHAAKIGTQEQLRILPIPPERSIHSSWRADGPHYPIRDGKQSLTHICPGLFWPEREYKKQVSQLVPRSDGSQAPVNRFYPTYTTVMNGPLIIRPGRERNVCCFVVSDPESHEKGQVIYFRYDMFGRPTICQGNLETRIWSAVLKYETSFQQIDTSAGHIEIASQRHRHSFEIMSSCIAAKEWANSPAFEELMVGENNDDPTLPRDALVMQLGDNIKVVFLPQDDGHRVLLAFHGAFDNIYAFPRAWMWPVATTEAKVVPTKQKSHKPEEKGLSTRLKGLFK